MVITTLYFYPFKMWSAPPQNTEAYGSTLFTFRVFLLCVYCCYYSMHKARKSRHKYDPPCWKNIMDRTLRGPTCFWSCGMTSRTRWKWGGWKKYCAWASPRSLKVPDFFDFLHFLEIFCFVDMQRQSTSLAFYFEYWWRAKSKSVTTNRRNIMKGPLQSYRLPLSLRKQNI